MKMYKQEKQRMNVQVGKIFRKQYPVKLNQSEKATKLNTQRKKKTPSTKARKKTEATTSIIRKRQQGRTNQHS